MNNPINAIDPDGEKVIIHYSKYGYHLTYKFQGFGNQRSLRVPNDQFILDFISAYLYNKHNGGGDNMILAVTNPKYTVHVYEASDPVTCDENETTVEFYNGKANLIWEPRKGIITTTGGRQSAATRLEHEFDHAIHQAQNGTLHREMQKETDKQYESTEERRVITGSEAKTAKANGESIRKDHYGKVYDTISPISTEAKKK